MVFVHLLPGLIPPGALEGGVAVVIDVLRASTMIVHALAAGCQEIIPCAEIDEARRLAAAHARRARRSWPASGTACRSRASTWATPRASARRTSAGARRWSSPPPTAPGPSWPASRPSWSSSARSSTSRRRRSGCSTRPSRSTWSARDRGADQLRGHAPGRRLRQALSRTWTIRWATTRPRSRPGSGPGSRTSIWFKQRARTRRPRTPTRWSAT